MKTISSSALFEHTRIVALSGAADSGHVALVAASPDRGSDQYDSALWLLDPHASQPRQLTREGDANAPVITSDGTAVAFLSSRGTQATPKPHVIQADGGEAVAVTSVGDLKVTSLLQWSSDRRYLLALVQCPYAEDTRDDPTHLARPWVVRHLPWKLDGTGPTVGFRTHLYAIDVNGTATPRPLTSGDFDVLEGAWSPDGTQLAYVASSSGTQRQSTNLWLRDGENCARPLTTGMAKVSGAVWSPDGSAIAFAGSEIEGDSVSFLYIYRSGGSVRPAIPGLQLEGSSIAWHPDRQEVATVISHQGRFLPAVVRLDSGSHSVRELGDSQVTQLAVAGNALVAVVASYCFPEELHRFDWYVESKMDVVSDFNNGLRDRVRIECRERYFEVPAGDGKTEPMQAWLLESRTLSNDESAPLLVDLHGGPHSVALMDFAAHVYFYALLAKGWRVIIPNPVGSTGFGESFAKRLRGRWGVLDLPQIDAMVAALESEGLGTSVVACAGKSYGGFLSAWAIANSQKFCAAVVSAPVADVSSHGGTSDSGFYVTPFAMGGEVDEVRERYDALSAVEYVGKVDRPILLLSGDADQRCPLGQCEELFARMVRTGHRDATMVVYPDGHHGLAASGRPSHREDYHGRIVDFLERQRRGA